MPAAKTGHGNQPGNPPASSTGAFAAKLMTTRRPPATDAASRIRPIAGTRPTRTRYAAGSPAATSAPLTATGAQTGPAHGTGIRNRTSHVSGECGQPIDPAAAGKTADGREHHDRCEFAPDLDDGEVARDLGTAEWKEPVRVDGDGALQVHNHGRFQVGHGDGVDANRECE